MSNKKLKKINTDNIILIDKIVFYFNMLKSNTTCNKMSRFTNKLYTYYFIKFNFMYVITLFLISNANFEMRFINNSS